MSGAKFERVSLQTVVNTVLDAALEPNLWPEGVRQAGAYCNSSGGFLFWGNIQRNTPIVSEATFSPDAMAAYFSQHFADDPARAFTLGQGIDIPSLQREWDPNGTLRDSELYRTFLREIDSEDRANVMLIRDSKHAAGFNIYRGHLEDPLEASDLARLRELSLYLRHALRISHRLKRQEAEKTALLQVVDQVQDGVFFLDRVQRAIYVNRVAERLVADGIVTLRNSRLQLSVNWESVVLKRVLESTIRTGKGEGVEPGGEMALHDENGKLRANLTALPLRTGHIGVSFGATAVCTVVFVRPVGTGRESPSESMLAKYRLTRAEASVAMALAKGQSLREIADARGLGIETVRTQLHAVFGKTGVRRQAELVKMLLSLPKST